MARSWQRHSSCAVTTGAVRGTPQARADRQGRCLQRRRSAPGRTRAICRSAPRPGPTRSRMSTRTTRSEGPAIVTSSCHLSGRLCSAGLLTPPEWPTGGLQRASGPWDQNEFTRSKHTPVDGDLSVGHSGGVRRPAPTKEHWHIQTDLHLREMPSTPVQPRDLSGGRQRLKIRNQVGQLFGRQVPGHPFRHHGR